MIARVAAVMIAGAISCPVAGAFGSSTANEERERLVELPAATTTTAHADDEATRNALRQVVPDIKFDDSSLSDAIDTLRDKTAAKLFVNWKSLEAAGIERNTPISLHLRKHRMSAVLDLLLSVAAADGQKLGYVIDDGVITISTTRDLQKNVMVRVYDARDILDIAGNAPRDQRVGALLKLLMDQVAPESWADRGGAAGHVRELQGQLIITQTLENHRRVVALLRDLRGLIPTQPREGFPLIRNRKP